MGCPGPAGARAMSPELRSLLASRAGREMTPLEREEQIISFAYGNGHLHNPAITREGVARHSRTLGEVAEASWRRNEAGYRYLAR